MAEPSIVQTIKGAEIDAVSLSEFVWKPADFMVSRRLAPDVHTLNYYINALENTDAAFTQSLADAQAALTSKINNSLAKVDNQISTAIKNAIDKSGFITIDSFETGATITARNQALRHTATGKLYRWAGTLPKTVSASSTPASSGGIAANAWLEVSDTVLRQELSSDNGYRKVANQMAAFAYGAPAKLQDMQLKVGSVTPADYFDGFFWGSTGGRVYKSADGSAWTDVCSTPTTFLRLIPTNDGEVLGIDTERVRKSSGWGGSSVTWRVVLSNPTSGTVTPFRAWGFDGNGDKFIINHYENATTSNWPDSRYVWISTDKGETWNVVWDTAAEYPSQESTSHLHAACYDKWLDRFWFAEGHGEMVGLRWSDDDGATWTRLQNDGGLSPAFTVMVPTDFGIVCGTDTSPNGIFVMQRAVNPETTGVTLYGKWATDSNRHGLYGFADRGFRDPDTGIVYMGWVTSSAEIPPVIMACGAGGASVVYTAPQNTGNNNLMARFSTVVAAKGVIIGTLDTHKDAGNFIAKTSKYSQPLLRDAGNILTGFGGTTREASFRIGNGSIANGIEGIALGNGANAGLNANQSFTVAVGKDSQAGASYSVAIGTESKAIASYATAIGYKSESAYVDAIAIGRNSRTLGNQGIAIGLNSKASNNSVSFGASSGSAEALDVNCVSVGASSVSAKGAASAIGYNAKAEYNQSTACGANSTSAGTNSVSVGANAIASQSAVAVGWTAKGSAIGAIAIGSNADATSSAYNIAIGTDSIANGGYALAIGKSAESKGYGIAIGANTKGLATNGITIGRDAKTIVYQDKSIAIGRSAEGNAAETLAIGAVAVAGTFGSIAIGHGATSGGSTALGTTAVGHNAIATHTGSVAIGRDSATVRSASFCVGERDFESTKAGGKIYLKSPNGTTYAITVGNDGIVVATAV